MIFFSACNVNQGNTDQQGKPMTEKALKKSVEEFVYPLPTPFELVSTMKNIGAEYVFEQLNPSENADNYFTEKEKALNLGIYLSDMSYSVIFNKNTETKMFMKTAKYLLNDLGVGINFENYLQEDMNEAFKNKDTIIKRVTSTLFETYSFLNEKNKPELAVLIVAGSWIEGLYLSTHTMEFTQWPMHSSAKLQMLMQQKESLDKLLELMKAYEQSTDVASIYKQLEQIQSIYYNMGDSLEAQEFNNLLVTIEGIRENIVK